MLYTQQTPELKTTTTTKNTYRAEEMAQWINMRSGVQSPRTQVNQADMVTVLRGRDGIPRANG